MESDAEATRMLTGKFASIAGEAYTGWQLIILTHQANLAKDYPSDWGLCALPSRLPAPNPRRNAEQLKLHSVVA